MNRKLVVFDVDGVLLDSLDPHLKVCEDLNIKWGLDLKVPNAVQFKELVNSGSIIAPMIEFFRTVGFKGAYLEEAVNFYDTNFVDDYSVDPFPGVDDVVNTLSDLGYSLGIVTANVFRNISGALSSGVIDKFNKKFISTKKDDLFNKSKELIRIVEASQCKSNEVVYVGDQKSDLVASKGAGIRFIGVSYGWGFVDGKYCFPMAISTQDIVRCVKEVFDV